MPKMGRFAENHLSKQQQRRQNTKSEDFQIRFMPPKQTIV